MAWTSQKLITYWIIVEIIEGEGDAPFHLLYQQPPLNK